MAMIAAVICVVAAAVVALATRRTLPALTADRLTQADARWRAARVRDYNIEIEVRGAQPAVYAVEVREGEPISATRNARPLTQRRTWETWTVPGMFDTLASDVDSLAAGRNLVVRSLFTDVGLPERYERIEMGTGHQVSWEVKRFEVLSP